MNAPVNRWKSAGRLFFWHYVENAGNYPGWHFALDRSAVGSLSVLIDAMMAVGAESSRTFDVFHPPLALLQVAGNKGGLARWQSPKKLRVRYCPEDGSAWSFGADLETMEWTLGRTYALAVANVFRAPAEYFDTTIGAKPPLWSWGIFE